MNKFLICFVLLLSVSFAYSQTVYVCSGSKTSKYHIDKNCRGLKSCGSPVKATTVAAMSAQGRSACKICSGGVSASANRTTSSSKQSTVAATTAFNSKKLELPRLTSSKHIRPFDKLRINSAQYKQSQLIQHVGYTTCYNKNWLIPNWVAYDLTKREVHGTVKRPNKSFEPDPQVKGRSAEHSDYTNSGYSRGHMAPAADMKWSQQAMMESFYLSNVCPQVAALNGGVWERLEDRCRALADEGVVYICCGPIVSASPKRIGSNGVAVPTKFFKVLCMQRKGKWQAVGFIMANSGIKGSMFDYAMPVDAVEKATGYDFFPTLPDNIETVIEANWKKKDWQ